MSLLCTGVAGWDQGSHWLAGVNGAAICVDLDERGSRQLPAVLRAALRSLIATSSRDRGELLRARNAQQLVRESAAGSRLATATARVEPRSLARGGFTLVLLFVALVVLGWPAVSRGESLVVGQWTFGGVAPNTPVVAGVGYVLKNEPNNASLRYQRREYGINLVWNSSSNNRDVSLERPAHVPGVIRFGEPVAVRIRGGGYLHYKEREYGINLEYVGTPVYEFELTGGRTGEAVPSGTRLRLYNRTHGDYIVYGERKYGINLRWYADAVPSNDYPPLPFPQDMRGPSGEPGQILLAGTARKVELFHGGTDDELDWHIFIEPRQGTRMRLLDHLLRHGKGATTAHYQSPSVFSPLNSHDLAQAYCEWMVIDGYRYTLTDDKWYSADVTRTLGLQESAWRYSIDAANSQGGVFNQYGSTVTPRDSRIVNQHARVYLQGAFVNDADHRFRVEIHPLDSVAYALDPAGSPIGYDSTDSRWPTERVTWRVAAFTNSAIHRINKADYLAKTRTTTWYLPLPARARAAGMQVRVEVNHPGFRNNQTTKATGRRPSANPYLQYGVASTSYAIEPDPRDGVPKLRVTVAMARPDKFGGMFQGEYTVSVAPSASTQALTPFPLVGSASR